MTTPDWLAAVKARAEYHRSIGLDYIDAVTIADLDRLLAALTACTEALEEAALDLEAADLAYDKPELGTCADKIRKVLATLPGAPLEEKP